MTRQVSAYQRGTTRPMRWWTTSQTACAIQPGSEHVPGSRLGDGDGGERDRAEAEHGGGLRDQQAPVAEFAAGGAPGQVDDRGQQQAPGADPDPCLVGQRRHHREAAVAAPMPMPMGQRRASGPAGPVRRRVLGAGFRRWW
jgi:hypothetical protein